jgi:multiple sugar transport system permease protein
MSHERARRSHNWAAARLASRIGPYAAAVAIAAYTLAPFTWMIISSAQTEREIVSVPPHWIPREPTLANYRNIFFEPPRGKFVPSSAREMLPAIRNSTLVALAVLAIDLVLAVPAAFAFARFKLRYRDALIYAVLGSRIIPDIVLIIPFFLVFQGLALTDTLTALTVSYVGMTLPFTVFVLAGYFETIPEEITKAARIDGCNRFQALLHVVLPLSGPALVAAGVFAFITCWNEFLFAFMLTQTEAAKTVTVVLSNFTTDVNVDFALMNAAGVIAVVPPVVLALAFRRFVVSGLTTGAVKG